MQIISTRTVRRIEVVVDAANTHKIYQVCNDAHCAKKFCESKISDYGVNHSRAVILVDDDYADTLVVQLTQLCFTAVT